MVEHPAVVKDFPPTLPPQRLNPAEGPIMQEEDATTAGASVEEVVYPEFFPATETSIKQVPFRLRQEIGFYRFWKLINFHNLSLIKRIICKEYKKIH